MFTLIMVMSSLVYAMSKLITSDTFNICSLAHANYTSTKLVGKKKKKEKQKRRPKKKYKVKIVVICSHFYSAYCISGPILNTSIKIISSLGLPGGSVG